MNKLASMFLFGVFCLNANAVEIKQDKKELNKQLAILESKVFALENENKKLKKEIDNKDKALKNLAILLSKAKTSTTPTTINQNRRDSLKEARAKAELREKVRSKATKDRHNALIYKRIKYEQDSIEKNNIRKKQLEKEYSQASKAIKDANNIIGRDRRKEALSKAYENKRKIYSDISGIDTANKQHEEKIAKYKLYLK